MFSSGSCSSARNAPEHLNLAAIPARVSASAPAICPSSFRLPRYQLIDALLQNIVAFARREPSLILASSARNSAIILSRKRLDLGAPPKTLVNTFSMRSDPFGDFIFAIGENRFVHLLIIFVPPLQEAANLNLRVSLEIVG